MSEELKMSKNERMLRAEIALLKKNVALLESKNGILDSAEYEIFKAIKKHTNNLSLLVGGAV